MAYPETGLARIVELYYDGAWQDVSSYVYARDPIRIQHGSTSEKDSSQPASCTFTLDNRDGRFSPRNQASPLFGKIGRNTPCRVSIEGVGASWLAMDGASSCYISAPDSAGLSVTGDIDIRIDLTLSDWRDTQTGLCGKRTEAGSQRSWDLFVNNLGFLLYRWWPDGTTEHSVSSRVALPMPYGRRATIRVTHDVDDGAGGNVVTFYYSLTAGTSGPWRQLGDPVTSSGTTSIFDSTSSVFAGVVSTTSVAWGVGRVHAFELRNGIAGSVVASPDCDQTDGTASFSDGTNTWTVSAAGEITSRNIRFSGEVAAWPVKRVQSGQDLWIEVEAAGILRRLGQGAAPLLSTVRSGILGAGDVVKGYWPLEDADSATMAASGLSGGYPMSIAGSPHLASFSGFDCSLPVPTLEAGASLTGQIRRYTTAGGEGQLRFLLAVPADGDTDGAVIASVSFSSSSTVGRIDVLYYTGGALGVTVYDPAGATIDATGAISFDVDGKLLLVSLDITIGAGVLDFGLATYEVGATDAGLDSWTVPLATLPAASSVMVNRGGLLTQTSVGHVYWQDGVDSIFDLRDQVNAYAGETGRSRFARICEENGIPAQAIALGSSLSTAMGPQPVATALEVLREIEASDGGILHDSEDSLGLVYRTRETLCSPGVRLILDGDADLFAIEATDDDQYVTNDLTVSRKGGASSRVVLEDGALSIQAPPDGVGRYDAEMNLSLFTDSQTLDEATWRLAQGTIDRPRYPAIGVNLSRSVLVADQALTADVLAARVGDRLTLTSPPAGLPAEDQELYVVGRTELLDTHEVIVTWPGVPMDAWNAAFFDHEFEGQESRYSSDGSTANGAHSDSTTSLSVATATGPLWAHDDGDFTIIVRETGERMTVTGVSGTTSPQTFTVTRGVESTTAVALSGGETVELARPVRYVA